jgi:ABC-type Fe3+/spermidine/putrescine transport system ATPase subunit
VGEAVEKGEKVIYAVRPTNIFVEERAKKCSNRIEVKLIGQLYIGSTIKYVTQLPSGEEFKIVARGENIMDLSSSIGGKITVGWNSEDAILLKE